MARYEMKSATSCQQCGKEFYRYPSHVRLGRGVFCSRRCHYDSRRTGVAKNRFSCETCGKEVERIKNGDRKPRFCSLQCRTVIPVTRKLVGGYWFVRLPLEERRAYHARSHHRRLVRPWVPEHIVVAERALGRALKKGEIVHHINCDQTDNRNSNLLVCTRAYHAWLHFEMSRRYGQEKFGRVAS